MVHWTDHTASADTRRPVESPRLWVSLMLGSLLLHVLLFWGLRFYLMRTVKVAAVPAPITIEFVPASNPTTVTRRNRSARSPSMRSTNPTLDDRASTQPAESPTVIAPDALPANPVSEPSNRPSLSRDRDRPQISPVPIPPRQPPRQAPVTPPDSPPPARRQPPPSSTVPPAETPPRSNTGEAPGSGSTTPPEQKEPASSGVPLPPTQGGKATAEVIGTPYQQQDFKVQPAKPRQANRELSIYAPGITAESITLRVHLDIDANGRVLQVMDVEPLDASGQQMPLEQLKNLAKQVFVDWGFEPAQDAQDGKPLQPVRSDLFVEARITLR